MKGKGGCWGGGCVCVCVCGWGGVVGVGGGGVVVLDSRHIMHVIPTHNKKREKKKKNP